MRDVLEDAIDPEPDTEKVFLGFDVDVRGTISQPLCDQHVHDLGRERGCSDGRQLKDHRATASRALGPAVFQLAGSLVDCRPDAVYAAEDVSDVTRSGYGP